MQKDGKSARRAFGEIAGTSWAKVEKEWKAHLRTLDLSAAKSAGGV
jgi:hypothetical protein